jgi:hypothetical protein
VDSQYRDRWIECFPDRIEIRGYYFPWWRPKRIPFGEIQSLRRVDITASTGKLRIWGTDNPHYWLSLDPQRPRKKVGLILDVGRYVRPFITPDDPDAVEAIIRQRAGLGPDADSSRQAPFV